MTATKPMCKLPRLPKHLRELSPEALARVQQGMSGFRFGFALRNEVHDGCKFVGNFGRKADAEAAQQLVYGVLHPYLNGRLREGWAVWRPIRNVEEKLFTTWKWGNNPTNDEFTSQACAIVSNCYASNLEVIKQLVGEARSDFPKLRDKDMKVVTFAGTSNDGIIGLQFDPGPDHSKVPDSYRRVDRF